MPNLKVDTVAGTDIFVNDRGKFYAEIGSKTITRASLSALKKLLEARASPLPVIVVENGWGWKVRVDGIVGATRKSTYGGLLRGQHETYQSYGQHVYAYDETALRELEDILHQAQALTRQWHDVCIRLVPVTPANFEELRTAYHDTAQEAP